MDILLSKFSTRPKSPGKDVYGVVTGRSRVIRLVCEYFCDLANLNYSARAGIDDIRAKSEDYFTQ